MFKKKVFAKHLDNLLFILITFLRIPRTLVSLNIAELEYTVTVLLQTPRTESLFCFPKLKILSWNNALILFMREKPSWNISYQWTTTWTTHEITADMHVVWCYVKHRCLPKLTNTDPQHCFPKLIVKQCANIVHARKTLVEHKLPMIHHHAPPMKSQQIYCTCCAMLCVTQTCLPTVWAMHDYTGHTQTFSHLLHNFLPL